MERDTIKIHDIKHIIPNILLNKLIELRIETVKQLIEIDMFEFSKTKGVGRKICLELDELQKYLLKHPETQTLPLRAPGSRKNILNIVDEDLKNVTFDSIQELLPKRLFIKFKIFKINKIGDLCSWKAEDFESLPSVGKSIIIQLNDFINDLEDNRELYLRHDKRKNHDIVIPKAYEVDLCFSEAFVNVINEYIELFPIKKSRLKDFVSRYYGLKSEKKYSMTDIGLYFDLSRERIRQLLETILLDIKRIFSGESSNFTKLSVRREVVEQYKEVIDFLSSLRVVTEKKLIKLLNDRFLIGDSAGFYSSYFQIICDVNNYTQSANTESNFTKEKIYVFDKEIDKKHVLSIARHIFSCLSENNIPIEEFELVVKIKKKFKFAAKDIVELICDCYPEIEKISFEKLISYQIKFEFLSSLGDMAERVLFENKKATHIDDIVIEIKKRLSTAGINKKISKTSTSNQLRAKPNVSAKGKTGYYFIKSWGDKNNNIKDLIHKAVSAAGKPLSPREISCYVRNINPDAKENSIKTIVNMELIKIKGGLYISEELRSDYKDSIIFKADSNETQNKDPKYKIVFNLLANEPEKSMELKVLKKRLKTEIGFSYSTITSVLKRSDLFESFTDLNGLKKIRLTKDDIESKINLKEKILAYCVDLLKTQIECTLKLSDIVQKVSRAYPVNRSSIYRVISLNPHVFKKLERKGEMLIRLEEQSKVVDNWVKMKEALNEELKDFFSDVRQPQYVINLNDCLEIFKKVIDFQTGEAELDGLHEQILPTLYKFYHSSNDKADLLNYFTQISTSLDPYLQKVLLLVDEPQYRKLKAGKTGLGGYIKVLNKLDPSENRYKKHVKDVPLYKFGKQMHCAYNSRNKLAHSAKKWSNQAIVNDMTETLVIYLFSTFEYSEELKNKI